MTFDLQQHAEYTLISRLGSVLTDRRQLVLDLQHDTLTDVLQQTDDLIVSELGQVDAVHGADVVADVQLVAPAQSQHQLLVQLRRS